MCGTRKGGDFKRNRVVVPALALAFILGITAQASGPLRQPLLYPGLTFSGTVATCKAEVYADKVSDQITVTMKLWHNGSLLKSWTKSGSMSVQMTKAATVVKGKTYKLTVDVSINGIVQPQKSITKTCP